MKIVVIALALGMSAAPSEGADPKPQPLQLSAKSAIQPKVLTHQVAPFVAPSAEPLLDLLPRIDPRQDKSRSSCSGENSLCYDQGSGRIVYKPARAFMPDIPGLRRENISVKRDRIVLRYSF